ncbi:MAG: hypothetical protein ACRCSE_01695 [Vibrio sp.]
MRPETLLSKFSLKGLNYEQMHNGGGKGLFSLEEQLAMVGIAWKESPVGFLVLFVEMQNCRHSRRALETSILGEIHSLTFDWRGQKSDLAFAAMVNAAVEESITPLGKICPCCAGSGKYMRSNRNLRTCVHCNDGRITWSAESRFVAMCSAGFACTYSAFKRKYHPILDELARFLAARRNAAMLALMDRISKEEAA